MKVIRAEDVRFNGEGGAVVATLHHGGSPTEKHFRVNSDNEMRTNEEEDIWNRQNFCIIV